MTRFEDPRQEDGLAIASGSWKREPGSDCWPERAGVQDFGAETRGNRASIYLDNGAMTAPMIAVRKVLLDCLDGPAGNPSSPHHNGEKMRRAIERARIALADFICAREETIVFTSGATEANHAVLLAALCDGRDLIATQTEHPSTLGVYRRDSHRIHVLPVGRGGSMCPGDVEKAAFSRPGSIVALSWVNSETGVIQPAHEICRLARNLGLITLVDASQAVGRISYDELPDADFISGSGHKMNALSGTGYLVINRRPISPAFQSGGDQEGGNRAGTENILGIVAIGTAAKHRAENLPQDLDRIRQLRNRFETDILAVNSDAWVNGSSSPRAPGSTSITFPGVDGTAIVAACDAAGLVISQVSACSSARPAPSPTLTAMGLSEDEAFSTIRAVFGVLNTEQDAIEAARILNREISRLRTGAKVVA